MVTALPNEGVKHAPTLGKVMWLELKKDKLALVAFFLFFLIVTVSFVWGAMFTPDDYIRVNLFQMDAAPAPGLPLGADPGGRDMIPMLVVGARNSFVIAFSVSLISSTIALMIGLFAGFYGGHVDNMVMRVIDFFAMTPTIMVIIVLIAVMPHYTPVTFALIMTLFNWVGAARNIRLKALQQGVMDYVAASKTLGTPNLVIIFREVFPNVISFVVVQITLLTASNMGLEIGLSFLGFGLPTGYPSLGILISHARNAAVFQSRLWQWLPAALLIFVMCLCINYVGQVLNRAADVKRRTV